jgi:galactokinase
MCFKFWYLFIDGQNDKKVMNFKSLNQPEIISLGFNQLTTPLDKSWVNYPLGVIAQFVKRGIAITEGYKVLLLR